MIPEKNGVLLLGVLGVLGQQLINRAQSARERMKLYRPREMEDRWIDGMAPFFFTVPWVKVIIFRMTFLFTPS